MRPIVVNDTSSPRQKAHHKIHNNGHHEKAALATPNYAPTGKIQAADFGGRVFTIFILTTLLKLTSKTERSLSNACILQTLNTECVKTVLLRNIMVQLHLMAKTKICTMNAMIVGHPTDERLTLIIFADSYLVISSNRV